MFHTKLALRAVGLIEEVKNLKIWNLEIFWVEER